MALPDSDYIVSRYGATGVTATNLKVTYDRVVPIALGVLSSMTDLRLPADQIHNERMVISAKVDFVAPNWWPVTEINRVSLNGSTKTLRIAGHIGVDQQDVFNGKADVAIGEDGETILLANWLARMEQASIFVDYYAGLDTMTADLTEVFYQLCRLIAAENDRVGKKSDHMDVAQTDFTRQLPDWAQGVLSGYRRVGAMYA